MAVVLLCDLVGFWEGFLHDHWCHPQETRNNTRHANLDNGRHRELPKLSQISATSNSRSPARVQHVEGGLFCEKPTKSYWNCAILTTLKACSNFQVHIELGINTSAGLGSQLNLVSKFKQPFVNSCHIQIFKKHYDVRLPITATK